MRLGVLIIFLSGMLMGSSLAAGLVLWIMEHRHDCLPHDPSRCRVPAVDHRHDHQILANQELAKANRALDDAILAYQQREKMQ
jgi:hypothetical protein